MAAKPNETDALVAAMMSQANADRAVVLALTEIMKSMRAFFRAEVKISLVVRDPADPSHNVIVSDDDLRSCAAALSAQAEQEDLT